MHSSGKYTFFTLTFVAWVLYLLVLHRFGKGIRNPRTGELLPPTAEQNWAAVLGAFCVWYNDPAFAASVTAPTFAASGFYAVCAVTFLIVRWARKSGEGMLCCFPTRSVTRYLFRRCCCTGSFTLMTHDVSEKPLLLLVAEYPTS
jgi:hypothetical protein